MDSFTFNVTTTGNHPIPAAGNFIRYKEATAGQASPTIRVKTSNGDRLVMDPGDRAILPRKFDRIEVENYDAAVTVAGLLIIGEGDFDSAQVTGSVSITQAGTITNVAEKTVGVAEGAVAAASSGRRSLRFRAPTTNTDNIYLGAAGITTANGCVELKPGDTWVESDGAAAAWLAISGTAAQKLRVQEIS